MSSNPGAVNLETQSGAMAEVPCELDTPDDMPPPLKVVPTIYPTSPPVEQMLDRFWSCGPQMEEVSIEIEAADTPLQVLESLGPSPFPRSGFPLIGFLATTYEKVSRYALDRQ